MFGDRRWRATPLRRLTLLVSLAVGLACSAIYAAQIRPWLFAVHDQLAYREDDGRLVIRRMGSNEKCPEVLVWGDGGAVCGWGNEAKRGFLLEILPMHLSDTDRAEVQTAFAEQQMLDIVWYSIKIASVDLAFFMTAIAFALAATGAVQIYARIRMWVVTRN